jgi:hypothetical protein
VCGNVSWRIFGWMGCLAYHMLMYIMKPPKTLSQAWRPPSGGGGIADSVVRVEWASVWASLSCAFEVLTSDPCCWIASWFEDEGRLLSSSSFTSSCCESVLFVMTCFSSLSTRDDICEGCSVFPAFVMPLLSIFRTSSTPIC